MGIVILSVASGEGAWWGGPAGGTGGTCVFGAGGLGCNPGIGSAGGAANGVDPGFITTVSAGLGGPELSCSAIGAVLGLMMTVAAGLLGAGGVATGVGRCRPRRAASSGAASSTGAPHCIIKKDDIIHLMPKRHQRPLFLIDLAVPRDIEAEVNKIDNVYLYDIDDLQKIVDENIALRKNELENCEKIILSARMRFMEWLVKENIKHHEN